MPSPSHPTHETMTRSLTFAASSRRRPRGRVATALLLAATALALAAGPVAAVDPGSDATAARTRPAAFVAPSAAAPTVSSSTREPIVRSLFRTPVDLEPPPPVPGSVPVPPTLDLFRAEGFRYQDPNLSACTAASALVMLNFIALNGTGGSAFRWTPRWGSAAVDSILAWERSHDTLAGGTGSDPHGWRNALNYYGWGTTALWSGARVYEDLAFSSYDRAIKTAIRQLIHHRKPVGIVAWQGRHAQMITGYAGLVGNPFARDAAGRYTNAFSVTAVYLSDPLRADGFVDALIPYETLRSSSNSRLRFLPYRETDSPYDDPYTKGWVPAREEWYGRWVIVAPIR
jgi:hypothetical protein